MGRPSKRRTVSFRPQVFVAAKAAAKDLEVPLAAWVEALVLAELEQLGMELPSLQDAVEQVTASRTERAKKHWECGQHFTF